MRVSIRNIQERNAPRSKNGGEGSQVLYAGQSDARARRRSDRSTGSVTQVSDFDSDLERQRDRERNPNAIREISAADRIA